MMRFIEAKQYYSSLTSYLKFNRKEWAALKQTVPLTLNDLDIVNLQKINQELSLKEVNDIYLPLSILLNFFMHSNYYRKKKIIENFVYRKPYIIGIAGSVAAGKSTTARVLQALLSICYKNCTVELVTTDGFLYPNKILKERDLMNQKGFPETYDILRLINFISNIKSGTPLLTTPIYSHVIYDIVETNNQIIIEPDILILEGLNILQNNKHNHDITNIFISDFIDFSIYVDAPPELLQDWYISRFLKLRNSSFTNPDSHFYNYAKLSEKEVINIATKLWVEINYLNLTKNILPTRSLANLILSKSTNHIVEDIFLKKY